MRRLKKKYVRPKKKWSAEGREEVEFMGKYGLKNRKELWKTEALLRKYRRMAREIVGSHEKGGYDPESILNKLKKLKIIFKEGKIEDILNLTVEDILRRRIQTILYEKGLAKTIYHARQLIAHGHVTINGRKIKNPGYLVSSEEEDKISVTLEVQ